MERAFDLAGLQAGIEALFAKVGDDMMAINARPKRSKITAAMPIYFEVGDQRVIAVSFASGHTAAAPYTIKDFLTSVACAFPDHNHKRLHWRLRPCQEGESVRFRIGASDL